MKTVLLDPGHGGYDPGATAVDGRAEKHFTLEIAKAVAAELERYECRVIMTRQTDVGLAEENLAHELRLRARTATRENADLLVSLHHDAGISTARGGSLWIWTNKRNPANPTELAWLQASSNHKDKRSYPLAKVAAPIIREALAGFGIPWRDLGDPEGLCCADFGVLRHTEKPAFIIEYFFGTNAKDLAASRQPEFIPTMAKATAQAIAAALELPKKKVPVPIYLEYAGETIYGELQDGKTMVKVGESWLHLREWAAGLRLVVDWHGLPKGATVRLPR